jgi:hypothetical protein
MYFVRWNALRHDAAGDGNSAVADFDPRAYQAFRPDPCAIADHDGFDY